MPHLRRSERGGGGPLARRVSRIGKPPSRRSAPSRAVPRVAVGTQMDHFWPWGCSSTIAKEGASPTLTQKVSAAGFRVVSQDCGGRPHRCIVERRMSVERASSNELLPRSGSHHRAGEPATEVSRSCYNYRPVTNRTVLGRDRRR